MAYADTVNGAIAASQDRRWWNYSEASFDRTHNLGFHWVANLKPAGPGTFGSSELLVTIGSIPG